MKKIILIALIAMTGAQSTFVEAGFKQWLGKKWLVQKLVGPEFFGPFSFTNKEKQEKLTKEEKNAFKDISWTSRHHKSLESWIPLYKSLKVSVNKYLTLSLYDKFFGPSENSNKIDSKSLYVIMEESYHNSISNLKTSTDSDTQNFIKKIEKNSPEIANNFIHWNGLYKSLSSCKTYLGNTIPTDVISEIGINSICKKNLIKLNKELIKKD